jgi:hypothetical protein
MLALSNGQPYLGVILTRNFLNDEHTEHGIDSEKGERDELRCRVTAIEYGRGKSKDSLLCWARSLNCFICHSK